MAEWRDPDRWLLADCDPARVLDAASDLCEPAFRLRVAAWSGALVGRGMRRVGLHLADPLEFAAALWAIWQMDAIAVLPADLHADTLAALTGTIDGWISDQANVTALDPAPAGSLPVWRALDPDRIALRLFTSGSTGTPQPIDKSLGQLQAELRALQASFGASLVDAVVEATVSHQHIYGLLFRVLWPLCAGRRIGRERLAFAEDIASALARNDSVLVATPAHLSRLPEIAGWPAAAARLRRVFSSGGALDAAAAHSAGRLLGQPVCEIYGSSETGGIAWRDRGEVDSWWQPFPGVTVEVRGGRLWLRSPFLADPAHWVETQDRAEVAGSGFRLLGRADRIAKIEERRVSLTALEAALAEDDEVVSAHVLVLPGRRRTLGAVVRLHPEVALPAAAAARKRLAERLRRWLALGFDRVCWPRQWRYLHDLPYDARGKLSEGRLRGLFMAELPQPIACRQASGLVELLVDLAPTLGAFAGHFPDAPVLPGVALLDWVARWADEAFDLAGPFAGMEQLKFQRILRPGMQARFTLRCEDRRRVAFEVGSSTGLHASGRLRFGAD